MVAKCLCSGCGKYFVGPSVHDAHRVGKPSQGEKRRCLTTEEMVDQGFACDKKPVKYRVDNTPKTMMQDVWFIVADRERIARKFKGL